MSRGVRCMGKGPGGQYIGRGSMHVCGGGGGGGVNACVGGQCMCRGSHG